MNNNEHPRVLILPDATWADDNNIGNAFSSLFEGWLKDKIAMIYARLICLTLLYVMFFSNIRK